ncbi:hypothetical protein E1200_17255 [Actinomadura sp. GC306]|uniref:hypothetical protein n=1 Tax=Actinomadura sp. GC306 TaxID=2530367 RepID=UPI0010435CA9|nr:hypothetical protein [Actinomadura sp. GC306]TDC66100.1 hypothetical protein E1200_17255 [Actinomadura sp. GC306]
MTRTDTSKPSKPEDPAAEEDPVEEQPADEQAADEQAEAEEPTDEKPAKEDAAEEPSAEDDSTEDQAEPAKKKPLKKEPAKRESGKRESGKHESGKDEPAKDEPGEPVAVVEGGVKKVAGDGGGDGGARKRSRARMPGKAVLVRATVAVALIGSIITAGLQWYQADQAAQRDAERREVRTSAAEFGEALLSYDHTKLQAARDRVLGLASDDFAKTYDEAFTGGLEGVITKLKANATATVRAVYLEEIEAGTAKAVVVMDSEVTSSAGTRRVLGSYLDMRLARRGDDWKVTEVTSVGAANETMTNPDGEQEKPGAGVPSPDPSP